jgi:tetratricopeptide (TPR) repeat protein
MNPEQIFLQGCQLYEQQKYSEALPYFERVLSEHPDSFLVLYTTAQTYKMLGEWRKALDTYHAALPYNNTLGDMRLDMGYCFQQLQMYEIAVENIYQAIELGLKQNTIEQAYFNLALTYYEWVMQEILNKSEKIFLDEPIKHFQKVIALNPKNIAAHFYLGQLWFIAQNLPKAEEAYQKVVDMVPLRDANPYLVQSWVGLASVYALLDRFSRALICLETAIDLDSRVAEVAKDDPAFESLRKSEEYSEDFYDLLT